jgi:hypothetical protein
MMYIDKISLSLFRSVFVKSLDVDEGALKTCLTELEAIMLVGA